MARLCSAWPARVLQLQQRALAAEWLLLGTTVTFCKSATKFCGALSWLGEGQRGLARTAGLDGDPSDSEKASGVVNRGYRVRVFCFDPPLQGSFINHTKCQGTGKRERRKVRAEKQILDPSVMMQKITS